MMNWNAIEGKIEGLAHMKDLKVEDFAEEGGLAQSLIKDVGRDLKATQLRRFFHYVKDIAQGYKLDGDKSFSRAEVAALMPLLAYAKGRGLIPENFYKVMKTIFGPKKCTDREDFLTAANFLEAIMAYHKFEYPKS